MKVFGGRRPNNLTNGCECIRQRRERPGEGGQKGAAQVEVGPLGRSRAGGRVLVAKNLLVLEGLGSDMEGRKT